MRPQALPVVLSILLGLWGCSTPEPEGAQPDGQGEVAAAPPAPLQVRRAPRSTGVTFVLCPVSGSPQAWDPLLALLEGKDHDAVSFPAAATEGEHLRALLATLEALRAEGRGERVVLAGAGAGVQLAYRACAEVPPERLAGLLLIAPAAPGPEARAWLEQHRVPVIGIDNVSGTLDGLTFDGVLDPLVCYSTKSPLEGAAFLAASPELEINGYTCAEPRSRFFDAQADREEPALSCLLGSVERWVLGRGALPPPEDTGDTFHGAPPEGPRGEGR